MLHLIKPSKLIATLICANPQRIGQKTQTISRQIKKTQETTKTCQILRNVKIPPETSNLAQNGQKNPRNDQNVTSGGDSCQILQNLKKVTFFAWILNFHMDPVLGSEQNDTLKSLKKSKFTLKRRVRAPKKVFFKPQKSQISTRPRCISPSPQTSEDSPPKIRPNATRKTLFLCFWGQGLRYSGGEYGRCCFFIT